LSSSKTPHVRKSLRLRTRVRARLRSGPVRRTIEYGLFYFVVDRCIEVLAALLSEIPPVASHVSTVRTASAVALWVMLAVVVAEARRQYSANPWDPADLESLRPSRCDLALAGGAVALGAPIAARGWTTVARLTEEVGTALAAGREGAPHVSSDAGFSTKGA